jgi:hypothetical protein
MEGLPAKKEAMLDHMRDLVQKFVDKGLLEFSYVHHLLWEYAQEVSGFAAAKLDGTKATATAAVGEASVSTSSAPLDQSAEGRRGKSKMDELVAHLIEAGPKLMSTRPGAKVMTLVVSHTGAKERKRALKSLKGHTLESLLHDAAFMVVMRLVDVTDDTVAVQKALFDEIRSAQPIVKYSPGGDVLGTPLPALVSVALHRNGSKLLLHLLSPDRRSLEMGDEAELFSAAASNSKKAPSQRRREHLAYLRNPLISVSIHTHAVMRCDALRLLFSFLTYAAAAIRVSLRCAPSTWRSCLAAGAALGCLRRWCAPSAQGKVS